MCCSSKEEQLLPTTVGMQQRGTALEIEIFFIPTTCNLQQVSEVKSFR